MPCPHQQSLRPGLPPLTPRIAALPLDDRGYPIPFFVGKIDGEIDFRFGDPEKLVRCVKEKLCWTCGQPLGRLMTFAVGPMCVINRTSSEPPSHLDCVLWSVKGCPFLSRPNMVRREDELTEANKGNTAGVLIERNPGVTAAWTTRRYTIFKDPNGKPLFNIGEPESVTWWREGRKATRLEIIESIDTGLPALLAVCQDDDDAKEIALRRELTVKLIPPEMLPPTIEPNSR